MKKILILLTMSLLLVSLTSAWMPETHLAQMDEAMQQAPNSPVGLIIQNNYDDYIAGNILTDSSVFYYFSEGFTTIGKEYKATHSAILCKRAVELASNNGELAFAYGICAHHVEDAVAHNVFVPAVIERTKLVNGLVHIFAEEKVNDEIVTPELRSHVRSALTNKAPIHREFFIRILQSESGIQDVDVGHLYDAFVTQVAVNEKYSVGFKGFTAVPTSIHAVLILLFFFGLFGSATLFKKKDKNIFAKIGIIVLFFMSISIIGLYAFYLTGNLWKGFQFISTPVSMLMPTSGWEATYNQGVQETVKLMNNGALYVNNIQDPSGSEALARASASGSAVRIIVDILLVTLIGLFIYLAIKKKRRK